MKKRFTPGALFALLFVLIPVGLMLTGTVPAEWQTPKEMDTGLQPHGLCVADLDGDTYLDIVVANKFSNNVTVYFNGASGFSAPQTLTVAGEPEAVAVGDVIGDSNPDIVVVRKLDKKISVFPGTGGSFGAPAERTCGPDPVHVAVGDLDGDADDDIAVAETGGIVRIFYNTGTGLSNTKNLTTDSGTRKVVVTDLEGDSDDDIIAINEFRNNLTIYRRNGASWGSPTKLLTGSKPTGLAVGDIKGNSHKDIVICNYDENNVTVYEWDGAAWAAPYTLDVGWQPNDVYISDANNDGNRDIITADLGVATVTIVPNEAAGWGTKISKNVGSEPYSVVVEDMNKDTKKDIITTNAAAGDLSILYWIDNSPPITYGIPDTFSIKEDTPSNSSFIDLWTHFHDDETTDANLQFSVVNGSDSILIGSITAGRYFTLDFGPDGENWYGKRNFTVRCVDEKLDFVDDEFLITVESVNDKPVLESLAGKDIINNELMLTSSGFYAVEGQFYNKTLVSSDADNDTLTFKTNITEGSTNPHPRFFINPDNGTITFKPNNEDALKGFLFFNLSASDGKGGVEYARVTLGIQNMNGNPVIYPIGDPEGTLTARENIPFNYPVKGYDDDGDELSWSDDSPLFDISSDGNITFTPKTSDIGVHKFNITADDGNGGIAAKHVVLTVQNVNNPPDIPRILKPTRGATFFVNEIINLSAADCNDPDIPFGDELTYEWRMGDGSSVVGKNQTYQYTSEGTFTIELVVKDKDELSRSTNITVNIEGEGNFPPKAQTDKEYDDEKNDVLLFESGKSGYSIGADANVDINKMTTTRVGMNLEIVLNLQGQYSADVKYEVYVFSQFKESDYSYKASDPGFPNPDVPTAPSTYVKGAYQESQGIFEGSPEVLGVKNIKFTLPLSSLIGVGDFYFFGIASYSDNDTFKVDSVGDGKLNPTPYQPPPDMDDDDDESPLRMILIIILVIILCILFIFLVVWIVMKVRERGKQDDEAVEDYGTGQAPPPPQDQAPPPPPPEAPPMPPPPMMDDSELIPPDVPPIPPDVYAEEEPMPELIEPDRPAVPIGGTAADALDGLLLPPPDAVGGGGFIEPEPEPAPEPTPSVQDKPKKKKKDDIFDDLFTPIGGAGSGGGDGGGGGDDGLEVECYQCQGTINVTSDERPLVLKCPHCGTESMLP